MSSDPGPSDVTQVRELRRLFEESTSQEMRTMQEMDRKIGEVSEYIEEMQRFFNKKLSEIKDLKQTISDPTTGRVISGYSMAKDMIQKLEKKVAEKAKDNMILKNQVTQNGLQLSIAEKNAEEKSVRIKELTVDLAEKQRLIEEMDRKITEYTEGLQKKDIITEDKQTQSISPETKASTAPETKATVDDKDEMILRLRGYNNERNEEIKKLHDTITQLQKDLSEKETQQYINKQLSNAMKMRQLEPLAEQSPEIMELISELRQETASIIERLADAKRCQPVQSNASASTLPGQQFRGLCCSTVVSQ
jgi:hypothetical protein